MPIPFQPLPVRRLPPATKSSPQLSPVSTRAVSAPEVNDDSETETSVTSWENSKAGLLATPPWKCSMVTRMTSGAGDPRVTVTSGASRVSPRSWMRFVAAQTVSESGPGVLSW